MEDDSGVPSSRGRGRPTHREVYERLQVQVAELRDRMGGLPLPEEAEGIWRSIWYEEAHHSTALEGNTLVLKQVQQLLDEGRAVGDKELREYMEVQGYADAAEWIYQQAIHPQGLSGHVKILSITEVREIHGVAITPVWNVAPHPDATDQEAPDNYRRHDIYPFGGGMMPPPWPQVPSDLDTWEQEVNSLDGDAVVSPQALAAVHCRFEQIHPFMTATGAPVGWC